jgi:hypothetical protein
MKQSWRTLLLASAAIVIVGCRPRTADDVAGVYAGLQHPGLEMAVHLDTNGGFKHVTTRFDGTAVVSAVNFTGTWTFDSTQNLVLLMQGMAYVFDDRSTQATLVRTGTPTMPLPITSYTIGTNTNALRTYIQPVFPPLYRKPVK